jgi:Zn-dependent protease with chaperone function
MINTPIRVKTLPVLLAGMILFTASLFSQNTPGSYTPMKDDTVLLRILKNKSDQRFEADKAALQGENKKYLAAEFSQRHQQIVQMYDQQEFITDPEAMAYLNSLMGVILSANPRLKSLNPVVLFSKRYWPNAASYGEGTITFNIGLFNRLQNESQAVFILCHELSHLYLDHSNKAIERYVNTVNSKEFQQQLKEIKKMEYQQGRSLDRLVKNLSYKSRQHSRDHESQADSMALELMRPTGFDVRESVSCLALLDSVDLDKYNGRLHLATQFNFAEYPFRPRWIQGPGLTLSEAMRAHDAGEDREKDSLKTHPDCSLRIGYLKEKAFRYYQPSQQLFLVSKTCFDSLSVRFDYEALEYCFRSKETGRALYYALQLFYVHPDDAYLAAMVGKCLTGIYYAQQGHTLSSVTDTPSLTDSGDYGDFLRFLENVKLYDIASIGYYFMQQQLSKFSDQNAFMPAYDDTKFIYLTQIH